MRKASIVLVGLWMSALYGAQTLAAGGFLAALAGFALNILLSIIAVWVLGFVLMAFQPVQPNPSHYQ